MTRPSSAGDVPLDLVADRLGVVGVGNPQRADDVDRLAGPRPWGVDREVARVPQLLNLFRSIVPPGEAFPPGGGLGGRILVSGLPGSVRLRLVDPRPERLGGEIGEREAQVGEVALRVDEQCRQAGGQDLFDDHDAETGLARAGHAHDDAVGGEVCGFEPDVPAGALVPLLGRLGGVEETTDEELCHGASR